MSIGLAVGVCFAAYGFLSAYALNAMQQEQLEDQQGRLRFIQQQHKELVRKAAVLEQAADFTQRAKQLGLQRTDWTFYDVNLQAPIGYEAAQEMIYQCNDSALAYYWPISLEIKVPEKEQRNTKGTKVKRVAPADVIVSVKGRFVAR